MMVHIVLLAGRSRVRVYTGGEYRASSAVVPLSLQYRMEPLVDSHFHFFDLAVRDGFPRQNPSHGFPAPDQVHRGLQHLHC